MHTLATNVECTPTVTSKTIEYPEESPFTCGTYSLDGSGAEYHSQDDPRPTIQIDMIVDFACVWCLLAKKALDQAIRMSSDRFRFELAYRPFILFEALPMSAEGVPLVKLLEHNPCTREVFMNQDSPLHRTAAMMNMRVVPERLRITNTLDTHRLVCLLAYALKQTSQNHGNAATEHHERDLCYGRNSPASNSNTSQFIARQAVYLAPLVAQPQQIHAQPHSQPPSQPGSQPGSLSSSYGTPMSPPPSSSAFDGSAPAHPRFSSPLPSLPPLRPASPAPAKYDAAASPYRQPNQLPSLSSVINGAMPFSAAKPATAAKVFPPYIQSRQFDMIDFILQAHLEGAVVSDLDFLAATGEKFGLGPAPSVKEFLLNRDNLTACIMDNYRSIRDRLKIKGVPFFVIGVRPPASAAPGSPKNNARVVISGGDVRPETFLHAFHSAADRQ